MECKHCKSSWNSSLTVTNCPFCGKSICTENNDNLNLSEGIATIVSDYGIEILNDSKRLMSLIMDYVRDCDKEKKLFRIACNCGILKIAAEIKASAENQRDLLVKKAIKKLEDEAFFSTDNAEYIISLILTGLGVVYKAEKIEQMRSDLYEMLQSAVSQYVLEKRAERQRKFYDRALKCLKRGEKRIAYYLLEMISGYKDADVLLADIKGDILIELACIKVNGKHGYINRFGEIIIQPQFEDARGFSVNGLAAVKTNGKWGYINESGTLVIQPQFEDTWSFSTNGLAAVKIDGKRGCINESGTLVIQPQFDYVWPNFYNVFDRVEINGKWGYINESGDIIQPQFEYAYDFADNGLAAVKINGKWGCINESGTLVIQPQFEDAWGFSANGLAPVKINGKWGYIKESGTLVIQPQFEDAYEFADNGLAPVKIDGKWGYIKESGTLVIQPQFEHAYEFSDNDLAKVKIDGKWGLINQYGEFVTQPLFDDSRFYFHSVFCSAAARAKKMLGQHRTIAKR